MTHLEHKQNISDDSYIIQFSFKTAKLRHVLLGETEPTFAKLCALARAAGLSLGHGHLYFEE